MDRMWSKDHTNGFLVFLMLFISSRASGLANADAMIFVAFLINLTVMILRKIKIDTSILLLLPFLALLIYQNFHASPVHLNILRYVKLTTMILAGYMLVKIVKFEFFRHYTKFIYWAIIMSLPFYFWQQVSAESLHSVGTALNKAFPSALQSLPSSQSILFYTIEFRDTHRNSGPMWEPGGFAQVIVLALYFELLMNSFKITKRIPVYLLGIMITISTTGYLLTMIIGFVYLLKFIKNKSPKLRMVLYVVVLPVCIGGALYVFFATDIMYDKISFLFADQMEKVDQTEHVENLNMEAKFSLGRFGSLLIDFESMQDRLFFGRGYDDDDFRNGQFGAFELTNGLTNYIARLGILGFLWLIISLVKSGRLIVYGLSGDPKNVNLLVVLVLFISFSNPVLFTPFYIMLSFFFVPFKRPNHKILLQ